MSTCNIRTASPFPAILAAFADKLVVITAPEAIMDTEIKAGDN